MKFKFKTNNLIIDQPNPWKQKAIYDYDRYTLLLSFTMKTHITKFSLNIYIYAPWKTKIIHNLLKPPS